VDASHPNLPEPDKIVPYIGAVLNQDGEVISGGKMGQVNEAFAYLVDNNIQNPDILLIGYSAGADAALLFADEYPASPVSNRIRGRVVAVVMLGGTLSGYSEFRGTGIQADTPDLSDPANLYDDVVTEALNGSIPILAFDDSNAQWSNLWGNILTQQASNPNIPLLTYTPASNAHFEESSLDAVVQCNSQQGPPPPSNSGTESGTNVNENVRTAVITWLLGRGINPAGY